MTVDPATHYTLWRNPASVMRYVFVVLPGGVANKFGLTPEQFGENLRDNYQRHETEQYPAEPFDLAQDFLCPQFSSKYVILFIFILT